MDMVEPNLAQDELMHPDPHLHWVVAFLKYVTKYVMRSVAKGILLNDSP